LGELFLDLIELLLGPSKLSLHFLWVVFGFGSVCKDGLESNTSSPGIVRKKRIKFVQIILKYIELHDHTVVEGFDDIRACLNEKDLSDLDGLLAKG
jgi:hypothetical protein